MANRYVLSHRGQIGDEYILVEPTTCVENRIRTNDAAVSDDGWRLFGRVGKGTPNGPHRRLADHCSIINTYPFSDSGACVDDDMVAYPASFADDDTFVHDTESTNRNIGVDGCGRSD
jgi:hypothetical protein